MHNGVCVRVDKGSHPGNHGVQVTCESQRQIMKSIRNISRLRRVLLLFYVCSLALGALGPVLAQEREERHGIIGELDGAVNPISQRYISRLIDRGADDGAEVVIIKLNTPGGLISSMEKIVEDLLSDRVPTAVYVSPRGASAASAGTFITAAATFAVMAPATNIGAASPVGAGGEDLPETLKGKVVEHLAADMRKISEHRDRNAEPLVDTIIKDPPRSYTATEALEKGAINFIAQDVNDLLEQIHGKTVTVRTESGPDSDSIERTLNTRGLELRKVNMSFIERALFFLADPNISFLLLSIGGLGIVIELFNPGLIVPGVVGAILLLLAFVSLGSLPVNWAGVGFILLAAGLFAAEMFVAGFGILGIGAIIAFIIGGLLLFDTFGAPAPTRPDVRVNLYLLGSIAGVFTLFGFWFLRTVVQSRRPSRLAGDVSHLVGAVGVAISDLEPRGTVRVEERSWTAVTEDGSVIESGERVRIVKAEGPILAVVRADERVADGIT